MGEKNNQWWGWGLDKEISGSFPDHLSLMLGKPRIRLNNLKTSLRFLRPSLNPIIDSISLGTPLHARTRVTACTNHYMYKNDERKSKHYRAVYLGRYSHFCFRSEAYHYSWRRSKFHYVAWFPAIELPGGGWSDPQQGGWETAMQKRVW